MEMKVYNFPLSVAPGEKECHRFYLAESVEERFSEAEQRIKELEAERDEAVEKRKLAEEARDRVTEANHSLADSSRSTIAALWERMEREIENAADYWGDLTSDKYKPWVASRMAEIRKEMDIEKLGETEVKKVNQRLFDFAISIKQWSEAYPESVFPEPTPEQMQKICNAIGGFTLDRISAMVLRQYTKPWGDKAQSVIDHAQAQIGAIEKSQTCKWTRSEPKSDHWISACKEDWGYYIPHPTKKYCSGCGRPVEVVERKEWKE